ncbi:MAG TPA: DNA recombination protein RmuC [Candidatus Acidoferrales bacterium]|nr:DNA recombination protein RmuC [Candidatus Acidoferrales bacterium]
MLVLTLCFSAAAMLLSLFVLIRLVRSGAKVSIGQQVSESLASGLSSTNLRLDSLQQSFSNALTTGLEASSRGVVVAISQVKEETRARIDERLNALSNDLRAGFDAFRDGMEKQVSGARTETQESFARFSTTLDQRSALLQSQVTTALTDLQRILHDELVQGRGEARDTLTTANNALVQAFEKLQVGNERKLHEIRESLESKLAENIEKNIGAFKEMTAGIAELKTTSDRIMQVSSEIGELTDILKSPKLRGDFGEFELENMLKDLIPPEHYEVKSKVNGALADAAIILPEGKLCIDSKFPYENYKRAGAAETPEAERESFRKAFINDVWRYVDSIADKYIVPGVTLDIAFVFVPAEGVYYQTLLDGELQEHCRAKKVLPVSPNTLYAYLQVLGIGFRGLKLQEAAKRIESVLVKLKHEFDKFKTDFRLLGTHLQRAQDRFSDANTSAEYFSVTLDRLHLGSFEGKTLEATSLPAADPTDQEPPEA